MFSSILHLLNYINSSQTTKWLAALVDNTFHIIGLSVHHERINITSDYFALNHTMSFSPPSIDLNEKK